MLNRNHNSYFTFQSQHTGAVQYSICIRLVIKFLPIVGSLNSCGDPLSRVEGDLVASQRNLRISREDNNFAMQCD